MNPRPSLQAEKQAADLGITIITRPLTEAASIWLADYDTVVVHAGLDGRDRKDAIMHSLEHARARHIECTAETDAEIHPESEVLAVKRRVLGITPYHRTLAYAHP